MGSSNSWEFITIIALKQHYNADFGNPAVRPSLWWLLMVNFPSHTWDFIFKFIRQFMVTLIGSRQSSHQESDAWQRKPFVTTKIWMSKIINIGLLLLESMFWDLKAQNVVAAVQCLRFITFDQKLPIKRNLCPYLAKTFPQFFRTCSCLLQGGAKLTHEFKTAIITFILISYNS